MGIYYYYTNIPLNHLAREAHNLLLVGRDDLLGGGELLPQFLRAHDCTAQLSLAAHEQHAVRRQRALILRLLEPAPTALTSYSMYTEYKQQKSSIETAYKLHKHRIQRGH